MLSKGLCFALIVPAVLAATTKSSIEWRDCGKENATVRFMEAAISPHPVYFGEEGYLTLIYNILEELPRDASFYIDSWRGIRLTDDKLTSEYKLPCVFGSQCEFNICEWMEWEFRSCMSYHNSTEYCSCPVKPGIRPDIMEKFQMNPMEDWPSWFVEGAYTGRFTIIDGAQNELGCLLLAGHFDSKRN